MSGPTREQVLSDTDIARIYRSVYGWTRFSPLDREFATRIAALAYAAGQAAEREACAELCMTFDGTHESDRGHGPEMCADAIRARSNNKLKEAA